MTNPPSISGDSAATNSTSKDKVASSSSSFTCFSLLPRHISKRIITLACRSPPSSCRNSIDAAKRGRLELDATTTLSLTLVNKRFNKIVTPILWTSIAVKRPSVLIELTSAVEARPLLGKRIKDLHLGGDEYVINTEWPLEIEPGKGKREMVLTLKTTLSYDDMKKGLLPKWCKPHRAFALQDSAEGLDGRETAVLQALDAGLSHIDVNPYKREYGVSGKWIGLELWCTRLYELQATLDFYLMTMRRVDDAGSYDVPDWTAAKKLNPPSAGRYPRLVLTGFTSAASLSAAKQKVRNGPDLVVLTRAQLWHRITRRGSDLDQFEHPILWARTDVRETPLSGNGKKIVMTFLMGPHWALFKASDAEHEAKSTIHLRPSPPGQRDPIEGEDTMIGVLRCAPQYKAYELVKAAQGLMARAPQLSNLSITGTFELSLVTPNIPKDHPAMQGAIFPTFENLRSFNIGPNLPITEVDAHTNFRIREMKKLEFLRVSGPMLHPVECKLIAGELDCLPSLKLLTWELIEPCKPGVDSSAHCTQFLGRCTLLQGQTAPPSAKRHRPDPAIMEVRLHPKGWPGVFSWRTPRTTAEAAQLDPEHPLNESALELTRDGEKRRSSWLAGTLYIDEQGKVAPNRVVCTESIAAIRGKQNLPDMVSDRQGMRDLLEGTRDWWEECAGIWAREREREKEKEKGKEREKVEKSGEEASEGEVWPGKKWGRPLVMPKEKGKK